MPATLTEITDLHKALAHPARLRVLAMLRGGELCVCQIVAVLGLAPSTVSAHLAELRRAGLLEERKEGRWVHYRLTRSPGAGRALAAALALVEEVTEVRGDEAVVTRLRKVSVEALCRAHLDIALFGIRRSPRRAGG